METPHSNSKQDERVPFEWFGGFAIICGLFSNMSLYMFLLVPHDKANTYLIFHFVSFFCAWISGILALRNRDVILGILGLASTFPSILVWFWLIIGK